MSPYDYYQELLKNPEYSRQMSFLPYFSSNQVTEATENDKSIGGIDLTADNFNLETQGKGMDMSFEVPLDSDFDGLVFTVISIKSVTSAELTKIFTQNTGF
jgi:hypothetical protein